MGLDTQTSITTTCEINILDRPHSLLWRWIHTLALAIGGVVFLIGSCMFFPEIYRFNDQALAVGGWSYVFGSFLFLIADTQEWWYYRVGCLFDDKYRADLESQSEKFFLAPSNTCLGRYERVQPAINSAISVCASILYFVGSIYFIPQLEDQDIIGCWLFIVGSLLICISQSWKIYRSACTNPNDRLDRRFRWSNLFNNVTTFVGNVLVVIGGLLFLVGTILYLPPFLKNDSDEVRSILFFVIGSLFFLGFSICVSLDY